jgi:hypothetical protein
VKTHDGKIHSRLRTGGLGIVAFGAIVSCETLSGLNDLRGTGGARAQGGAAGDQSSEGQSGASDRREEAGGPSTGGRAREPERGQGGAAAEANEGDPGNTYGGATADAITAGTSAGGTGGQGSTRELGGAAGMQRSGEGGTGDAGAETGGDTGAHTGGASTGGTGAGGSGTAGAAGGGASTGGTCSGSLDVPANVQASDGLYETRVAVTWAPVPCAQSYEIYRAETVEGPYELLGSTMIAAYDDTLVVDTVAQQYRVRACSSELGCSDYGTDTGWRKQGYLQVATWGSAGSADGQFSSASGLAVDGEDAIYVADTYAHRVQKFTSEGAFVTKWGGNTLSRENGKFYYPRAIEAAGDSVYVGDMGRMQRFTLDGVYVDSLPVEVPGEVTDIDAGSSIFLAIEEFTDQHIEEYDLSYNALASWGSSGAGAGQFVGAIHIAVDEARSLVFVSDDGQGQIHFFTLGGTYVGSWGSSGAGADQLDSPGGIALDAAGELYVADWDNDRVQKLRFTGTTLELVASFTAPGAVDVAVDSEERVIVLGDATIRVFERR